MSDFEDISDSEFGLLTAPEPGQGTPAAQGGSSGAPEASTSAGLTLSKPTKRAAPRFLGDGLSDDDEQGSSRAGKRPNTSALFDDLDRIFDQDDLPPPIDTSLPANGTTSASQNAAAGGDNIDAALPDDNASKKRQPRAKLDTERLLGPKGFPKLIEHCKGFEIGPRGNEEKDLKRLLDMYQLWAHDMFPRTDFSESVQKIEKECKKRVMANEMRVWKSRGQGKLPSMLPEDDDKREGENLDMPPSEDAGEERAQAGPDGDEEEAAAAEAPTASARVVDNPEEDDEFDALIMEASRQTDAPVHQQPQSAPATTMATAAEKGKQPARDQESGGDAGFDDADLVGMDLNQFDAEEEEAMAAMG